MKHKPQQPFRLFLIGLHYICITNVHLYDKQRTGETAVCTRRDMMRDEDRGRTGVMGRWRTAKNRRLHMFRERASYRRAQNAVSM